MCFEIVSNVLVSMNFFFFGAVVVLLFTSFCLLMSYSIERREEEKSKTIIGRYGFGLCATVAFGGFGMLAMLIGITRSSASIASLVCGI